MGKNEQHQEESSKQAKKRSKKQSLAALAAARGLTNANGGIRISKMKDVEVEVACILKDMNANVRKSPRKHSDIPPPPIIPCRNSTRLQNITTLKDMNANVRKSPRKHGEIPPPSIIPYRNSTPLQNVTTTHSSNPHDSTLLQNVTTTHSSNPHDSTPLQNITTTQSSNPHNLTSPLHITHTNPQRFASPLNLDHSSEEANMVKTKRKRGKTMMRLFSLAPNEKVVVEFNKLGQPIGPNSKCLSSYLGTLAREMVPVTISDWKKVDDKLRADLWTYIQARFKLDAIYQNMLLKILGQRWKESKSRLVSAIRDASNSPDASNKLDMLKPDNIKSAQEWNDFVNEKLSEEFESKSNKYKAMRAKNTVPHTMSRKGYARLAYDMKKGSGCSSDISRDDLWCRGHTKKNGEPSNYVVADYIAKIKEYKNPQSSQGTISLNEDGVSKVFGRDHRGRIRGLGFGVSPTQFGVRMSSSKKVCEMENQITTLQAQMKELSDLFMANINGKQNVAEEPVTPYANTPKSHRSRNKRSRNKDTNGGNIQAQNQPRKCKLLDWHRNVVAEATIASTDPTVLVHHVPLGADAWKVWVNSVVDPEAILYRPTSNVYTIGQAVGTTVAWHKEFFSFD